MRLNFLLSTFYLILKRLTRKSVGSNYILYVILYVKIELVVTLSYYQLDFYVQSYVQVYSSFGSNINYYGMLAYCGEISIVVDDAFEKIVTARSAVWIVTTDLRKQSAVRINLRIYPIERWSLDNFFSSEQSLHVSSCQKTRRLITH